MPFRIIVKVLLVLDRWMDSLSSEVRDSYVIWRMENNWALASIEKQGRKGGKKSHVYKHLCQCRIVIERRWAQGSTRLVPA